MSSTGFVRTRVSSEQKEQIRAAAARGYLTEAAWARRAIAEALRAEGLIASKVNNGIFSDGRSQAASRGKNTRIHVRLKVEDRNLLSERASLRGMPSATYASVYLRSHLHHLAPLPREELRALKEAVTALGAIGRNLNQIAKVANTQRRADSPSTEELRALLRVCEAMRAHVKDLLNVNLRSWADGHADNQG